jgi:ribosomal protein S18 acetylase RimI-like enzyme
VKVRAASSEEVALVADLHAERITEGFLAMLGPRFLRRLYRRVQRSRDAFLFVAVEDGRVVGFLAGADDLRRLYRSFVARDGIVAGAVAAPRLARSLPRALETLRYPSSETDGLPAAEILSMAVDPATVGRGVGRALVDEGLAHYRRRGIDRAKVVIAAGNAASLHLYERAGFAHHGRIAVHRGTDSEVLVWSSPSPS